MKRYYSNSGNPASEPRLQCESCNYFYSEEKITWSWGRLRCPACVKNADFQAGQNPNQLTFFFV